MNKPFLCVTFNIPFLYSMLFCVEALSLPLTQPIHNMDYIQKLSACAKNNSPAPNEFTDRGCVSYSWNLFQIMTV